MSVKSKAIGATAVVAVALVAANQAGISFTPEEGGKILSFPSGGRGGDADRDRERSFVIEVRWAPGNVGGYWTSRHNKAAQVMPLGVNADAVGQGRPTSPQRRTGKARVGDYLESTMDWTDNRGGFTGHFVTSEYCRIIVGGKTVSEGEGVCDWTVS